MVRVPCFHTNPFATHTQTHSQPITICIYVYISIYIYIYTHVYTYAYVYIYIYVHVYIYIYICKYIYIDGRIWLLYYTINTFTMPEVYAAQVWVHTTAARRLVMFGDNSNLRSTSKRGSEFWRTPLLSSFKNPTLSMIVTIQKGGILQYPFCAGHYHHACTFRNPMNWHCSYAIEQLIRHVTHNLLPIKIWVNRLAR